MKNYTLYVNHAEKKSYLYENHIVYLHYFCSKIYSTWTKTHYKNDKNTIVNNFSTMRKRHATQCSNKVVIWVSNDRQFDGDHYALQ